MLITYQAGKGKYHLVPIIFPANTHHVMRFLVSQEARKNADVSEDNNFFLDVPNIVNHILVDGTV